MMHHTQALAICRTALSGPYGSYIDIADDGVHIGAMWTGCTLKPLTDRDQLIAACRGSTRKIRVHYDGGWRCVLLSRADVLECWDYVHKDDMP